MEELSALVAVNTGELDSPDWHVLEPLLTARDPSLTGLETISVDSSVESSVRLLAIWLLGRLGRASSEDVLITLASNPNWQVRTSSVQALGSYASRRAAEALRSAMLDSNPEVGVLAAISLGWQRSDDALPSLCEALRSTVLHLRVRGAAAEALATLGDMRAVGDLIEMTRDDSAEIRFWCAYALGELRAEDALPVLERLLVDERAGALGRTVSEEARAAIDVIRANRSGNSPL